MNKINLNLLFIPTPGRFRYHAKNAIIVNTYLDIHATTIEGTIKVKELQTFNL